MYLLLQVRSSFVHLVSSQITDLDAVESIGSCPLLHLNVTLDPCGKKFLELNSSFKVTFPPKVGTLQGSIKLSTRNMHDSETNTNHT